MQPDNPIPQIKPNLNASENKVAIEVQKPQGSKKVLPTILITVLAILGSILILVVLPLINVYSKAKSFETEVKALKAAAGSKNLPKIKEEIQKTKKSTQALQGSLAPLFWLKAVPWIGKYVSDSKHATMALIYGLDAGQILVTAVEPYADLAGFTGGTESRTGDGAKTAKDRIDFLVKSIPEIVPRVDSISEKVNLAKKEVDQISPDSYPVKFRGMAIREKIRMGVELVDEAANFIVDGKPLLAQAPYLLGIDAPRQYLVLFQNDKELRPTGGFLTAYSIMKVDKGTFNPVISSDIYNLDAKYKPSFPAAEPLVKYLKGPYILSKNIRLRDMNWSPDFAESMKTFIKEAEKVGIKDIDGIIAVDTHLLVNLLDALGQIGVPGFGNFSTTKIPECDCPQVIHELESFADVEGPIIWDPITGKIIYRPPNSDNRKKIIGPLMNSILANAMGQPKDKLPKLFEAGYRSLVEKHVLFYLFDAKAQSAVESFNIAGRIKDYDGDYLHVNDANLGGRKSNLYTSQEIEQEIKIGKDGSVEKTVTITYKNPQAQDGWLNSVLPNWVRVYVPKGSQLLAFEGVEDKAVPYEEFGKEVFAGFFKLRPQGVSKVTIKYKIPMKAKDTYRLLMQKQPGTDGPLMRIKLGKYEEEFLLKTDKDFKVRI